MPRRVLGPSLGLDYLPKFPTTRWYHWPQNTSTTGNVLNTLRVYPIRMSRQQHTDITAEVTTGGTAGAVLRLAIYNNDNAQGLYPGGTVLLDAGTVVATAAAMVTWSGLTFTPTEEVVWIGIVPQVATCTVRTCINGTNLQIPEVTAAAPSANSARLGMAVAAVSGAAPSNPTWVGENNLPPKHFFKVA